MNKQALLTLSEIDNLISVELERFIDSLTDKKRDIWVSRLGYKHRQDTFQAIADRNGVSPQTISGTLAGLQKKFLSLCPVDTEMLRCNITESLSNDIAALMPLLSNGFNDDLLFCAFLEMVCRVEKDAFSNIVVKSVDRQIINQIFCKHPSPIDIEVFIREIMAHHDYSRDQAYHGVRQLNNKGSLILTDKGIFPKNLSRREAVAHELLPYPEGMNFKDVIEAINQKGYMINKTKGDFGNHGFKDSEWVYLSGLGMYRHISYLQIESFDIPAIMERMHDFFQNKEIRSFHLHDYFVHDKEWLTNIDYYDLRYMVSKFGQEYGLFFNGTSSVDCVSIDQSAKSISQIDVIEKAITESDHPLHLKDLAGLIKSKNGYHAYQYVKKLLDKGVVVRSKKGTYKKVA